MATPLVDTLSRLADRSVRFGAFDPLLNMARSAGIVRFGPSISALVHASALRWPNRPAVIDDVGTLSYRGLDRQADQMAGFLRREGRSSVGILCRNHRGFPIAQLGIERAGRNVVLLSTALPAERLKAIADREQLGVIIADDEFADRLDEAGVSATVVPADPARLERRLLPSARCFVPPRRSDVILLTSGTTGPPKGARRAPQRPTMSDAGLLDAIPIRMNDVTMVASPLFHAWGLAQSSIALSTGSTLVLQSRFDATAAIEAIVEHDVTVLCVVPLMLGRLLDEAPDDLELDHVRLVLSSGNVLSATLAHAWIARFGPHLYNIYGSTETAIASVATPFDLVEAPGTVGRPPKGVTVKILDDNGDPVPDGEMGRVFTGNGLQFDGYTDGTDRARRGNLMATGDLGYLEASGRLFIDGRENDLIVTGGENVFPSRIEEILEHHPHVQQAAVVGLPDDEYGQRIVAFVVTDPALKSADLIAELDEWGREHLASFQRPREYRRVDALPMTTTGKVIRHALATLGMPEHL